MWRGPHSASAAEGGDSPGFAALGPALGENGVENVTAYHQQLLNAGADFIVGTTRELLPALIN